MAGERLVADGHAGTAHVAAFVMWTAGKALVMVGVVLAVLMAFLRACLSIHSRDDAYVAAMLKTSGVFLVIAGAMVATGTVVALMGKLLGG